jgi:hypothetical protein
MLHIIGTSRYRLAHVRVHAQQAWDDVRHVGYVTKITKIASITPTSPRLGLKLNDNSPSPLLTHKARIPIGPEYAACTLVRGSPQFVLGET